MTEATTTERIKSQNRVTIPEVVREKLGVGEGDIVEITVRDTDAGGQGGGGE